MKGLSSLRIAVVAGVLVHGSTSNVDILLAGDLAPKKIQALVTGLEQTHGREITYSTLSYDEFYYRFSMRDKFITSILASKHLVLVDPDNVLKKQ